MIGSTKGTAPYGSWPSPITAQDVAVSDVGLTGLQVQAGRGGPTVWWSEIRPAEAGRETVLRVGRDGHVEEMLPSAWSAQSRVHEYGGGAWTPIGQELIFVRATDQRLYRTSGAGVDPESLVPPAPVGQEVRYADLSTDPNGTTVFCVRERHSRGKVYRDLAAVELTASRSGEPVARSLHTGADFYSSPRSSPDGKQLVWLSWDHPQMPWDGTQLWVADRDPDGAVRAARLLAGGPGESVFQPEWGADGRLYFVSDRTGWWNLYRLASGAVGDPEPVCPMKEECGWPQWQFGYASYALLGGELSGHAALVHGTATRALGLLDFGSGLLVDLDLPYTAYSPYLSAAGTTLALRASAPHLPSALLEIDLATSEVHTLQAGVDRPLDPQYVSLPSSVTVSSKQGRRVHGHLYPPAHPELIGPADRLPPYVIFVHGGPTSQQQPSYDPEISYFTSRGLGVAVVHYAGSTGYGRAYREQLLGQWGIVDVEDCVAVAEYLSETGLADEARLAIRGASAGGWTTLCALTQSSVFSAGVSYYGVADLITLAESTHDFESHYLDGLVGPLPASRGIYRQRSPLTHAAKLSCPVLLLQGADDEVVPAEQAQSFASALRARRLPFAHLVFPDERHGFDRAETIMRALEAELSFYSQVLQFDVHDVPPLALERSDAPRPALGS